MLKSEILEGGKLIRFWATDLADNDENFKMPKFEIRKTQTNELYSEAVDLISSNFSYEVTENVIENLTNEV